MQDMDKLDLLASKFDQVHRVLSFYDVQEDTDVINQLGDLIVLSRAEKWDKETFQQELIQFWNSLSQTLSNEHQINTVLSITEMLPDFLEV